MQRTIEKELNLHVDVNKWANTSNLHVAVLHSKKNCAQKCWELNSESSELFRRLAKPISFQQVLTGWVIMKVNKESRIFSLILR